MMTTDRELKLERIARHLNVRILPDFQGELHPDDVGGWFPYSRRILYRPGLYEAETLCAIAHELAHAYYGDDYAEDHLRDTRQEMRADRWAARVLITASAYEQAESLVGSHPGALASELEVTVEYIHIWRDLYERIPTQ